MLSLYKEEIVTVVVATLLSALFCCGVVLGGSLEKSDTLNRWCKSVHEGQMQGDFCITPENAAIPRPEWSK